LLSASEVIIPFLDYEVKMVKHYLSDFSLQLRTQSVPPGLLNVIYVDFEPNLAFGIAFTSMNMDRFVPLVRVEEHSPSTN